MLVDATTGRTHLTCCKFCLVFGPFFFLIASAIPQGMGYVQEKAGSSKTVNFGGIGIRNLIQVFASVFFLSFVQIL